MKWMFDHVQHKEQSAVAELRKAMVKEPTMFLQPHPEFSTGESSWEWPRMAICKQKLVGKKKFDPFQHYTASGAHMPLMVFIGAKGKTRRTPMARKERSAKASARNWDEERRQQFKETLAAQKAAIRGGGGQSSSSQQVDATRGRGDKTSSESWSASGWSRKQNTSYSTQDGEWTHSNWQGWSWKEK